MQRPIKLNKKKSKQKQHFDMDEKESDCILHGYIKKLGGSFASIWQTKYAKLYPNRYDTFFILIPNNNMQGYINFGRKLVFL